MRLVTSALPPHPTPGELPASRTRRRLVAAAACGAAVGAVLVAGPTPASAASASNPMMFGSSASTKDAVLAHERVLGSRLNGLRVYKSWDSQPVRQQPDLVPRHRPHPLPVGALGRENGSEISFAAVAAARPGSALYQDMVDQARQVKAFGATVYIAYNHEPESHESWSRGTGAQYAAAYRNLRAVWASQGVTNARYVFATTAYGFARHDQYAAALYYPGDDVIDYIAADGYNWGNCRGDGGGWVELAQVIEAQRQFGLAHPSKGLMLYEFGSTEDKAHPGRKAQWLRNATTLFQQPGYGQYKVALSWEGRSFTGGGPDCNFDYTSSSSAQQAWADMAHAPSMRATRIG